MDSVKVRRVMTISEMQEHLKTLGLKKAFRPCAESETGAILLRTRKPATIVDGLLVGSEITLQGHLFRVWTPRRQLVRMLATEHGLKCRLLDGEAVLWIKPELADELLPKFGAKVKRQLNAVQKAALNARLAKIMPEERTHGVLNCPEGVRVRGGING